MGHGPRKTHEMPAFIAGLAPIKARVSVCPPLSAKGPSPGLMTLLSLTWSLFTPLVKPVELRASVMMLFPCERKEPDIETVGNERSLPTIVLSKATSFAEPLRIALADVAA